VAKKFAKLLHDRGSDINMKTKFGSETEEFIKRRIS
jgi:hypothetical protein